MLSQIKNRIFLANPIDVFKWSCITSLFFHIVAAYLSEGFHRPDEHLGMLRMMSYKLGTYPASELSWEIPAQIRSWMQPSIYYSIAKLFSFTGGKNPFHLAFILRLFSSILGFTSLMLLAKLAFKFFKQSFVLNLVIITILLNPYVPFFHARTTTENFGITFFIYGLFFLLKHADSPNNVINKIPYSFAFWAGACFSCSFIFRLQMITMIGPLAIWALLYGKYNLRCFIITSLAFIATLGIGLLIDYWGYGVLTFSPYNYVYQNIVLGKASGFGIDPWWRYLEKIFLRGLPPLSLLYLIPFIWMWYKKPRSYLTWISAPFFVAHSLIAHKELRFVFGLGILAPIALGHFIQWLEEKNLLHKIFRPTLTWLMIFQAIILLLISSCRPALAPIKYYHYLYSLDSAPDKIITLGVFRDQLKFYLKKPLQEVIMEDREQVKQLLQTKQNLPLWFLTDKLEDMQIFEDTSKCKLQFSLYPEWSLQFIKKYLKSSKVWILYFCQ